jgi:hypothetical protein
MTSRSRSKGHLRRAPDPGPPLSKAEALKLTQRLFFLSGAGPQRGRASEIQKGLRALARGYSHSSEMTARMSALRSAMGAYEFPQRRKRTAGAVAAANATKAARELWEHVFSHWPSRDDV